MTEPRSGPDPSWRRAELALTLLAIDPSGLGGLHIRARVGPVRERLTESLKAIFPNQRRIHPDIDDTQLFGGLDVAQSLHEGRPVLSKGLLADGGVVALHGSERSGIGLAGRLASAQTDLGISLVLYDEGAEPDERPPEKLTDPLAFRIDLTDVSLAMTWPIVIEARDIASAQRRLPLVESDAKSYQYLVSVALDFGIDGLRAPLLALRAARAHAALYARHTLKLDDLRVACELVYAHRATQRPADEVQESAPEPTPESEPAEEAANQNNTNVPELPQEVLLEAVRALLPPDLLARVTPRRAPRSAPAGSGSGMAQRSNRRGRPKPARPGPLKGGARLDIVSTLRSAVPWQPMRRQLNPGRTGLQIRKSDFRIKRYEQKSDRLLIFTVDASGSAAFARLAETKGAIELLLGEAYARRDHAALVAFRGTGSDVLLAPTRSLTLTKRQLAALPGGGGTPMASGMQEARDIAIQAQKRGFSPVIILLTDGRANIDLNGEQDRQAALKDAEDMAQTLLRHELDSLVIDTGKRPNANLQSLAKKLAAPYVPLPRANAAQLSSVVSGVLEE